MIVGYEGRQRDADRTAALNGTNRARRQAVPVAPIRYLQRVLMKAGRRTAWAHEALDGPPRILVRVDEFPHYRARDDPEHYGTDVFRRFHGILAGAGVPYLVAGMAAVARRPLDPTVNDTEPLDDGEREVLGRLPEDGVTVGLHGYDHRTRFAHPRRHSELQGLSAEELADRLDLGEKVLTDLGLPRPRVFVPPYNRFDAAQWCVLEDRYDVITGGMESVVEHGLWRTPSWRGEAVYLPAYHPYYGTAKEVLDVLIAEEPRGWVPIVLHWGWEADRGWRDLERLADHLASRATPWDEFLAAVEATR